MSMRHFLRPITQLKANTRSIFAGQDAWRRHPMLSNCVYDSFPGLGYASAIFGTYLVLSTLFDTTPAPHYAEVTFEATEVGSPPVASSH